MQVLKINVMGLYFGMRNSIRKSALNYEKEKISEFDPNPSEFVIKKHKEINGNLAIFINYPNCKNYEGNKIILYKGITWQQIQSLKEIDPHFSDKVSDYPAPFARFEPTEKGWDFAITILPFL